MIKNKKTGFFGVALLIFVFAIYTFSYANADELLAVKNTKPVLRSTPASNSIQLRGSTNITKTNPKITLSLKDSDVQPVLRMFADKAGLNIIFHQSATGSVTLDLVNVPLNDAFRMVLQVTDLTYHMDGKTLVRLTEPIYTNIRAVSPNMFRATLLDYYSEVILNGKGEVIK